MNKKILKKAIFEEGGREVDYNWMLESVEMWEENFFEKVWKKYFDLKDSAKLSSGNSEEKNE